MLVGNFELGLRAICLFVIVIALAILLPLWGPVWLLGWGVRRVLGDREFGSMGDGGSC